MRLRIRFSCRSPNRLHGDFGADVMLREDAAKSMWGIHRGRLSGLGRDVEPLLFAFAQPGQPDPAKHARLIPTQLEHNVRRRAVEKVDAPLQALPPQEEP